MTEDDIQLLYEYDRWANNRVFKATSALSVEQFLRLLRIFESMLDLPCGAWLTRTVHRNRDGTQLEARLNGAQELELLREEQIVLFGW
jgi:uncharacterized damage-inducible protein DinB